MAQGPRVETHRTCADCSRWGASLHRATGTVHSRERKRRVRRVGFEKCKNASDRAWILDDEKEVSRELNLPNSTKNPEGILRLEKEIGAVVP